ncbi:MAG: lipopolysaccharide assembly protein LapA domain-containing protein [Hyphomicrobiales bacterium]
MKRLLSLIFGLPAAVIIVALSVANRQPVRFSIDPFSQSDPVFVTEVPLFLIILASIFIGLLFGGMASWLAQGKWRRAARSARAEGIKLKQEHETLKRQTLQGQSRLLTSGERGDAAAQR